MFFIVNFEYISQLELEQLNDLEQVNVSWVRDAMIRDAMIRDAMTKPSKIYDRVFCENS